MKFYITRTSLLFIFSILMTLSAVGNPRSNRNTDEEKKHLFPGTGFFIKNRNPYENEEAKEWFIEALKLQKENKTSDALKQFEKFSKRRCDLILNIKDIQVMVGPEALYQASVIREKQGDWKKAFDHLQLIARAYVSYDFERVAISLMRIAELLATAELPKKWGVVPRLRSGSEDRERLNQIVELSRGPRFAPRALMVLAEISQRDGKEEEAVSALERLVNFYPDHYLSEKAYFKLGQIHQSFVSGYSYDQGATLNALNYFEDYLILYDQPSRRGPDESVSDYEKRLKEGAERKKIAQVGKNDMRESLAQSKLEIGQYIENYGKYFLTHWRELGNQPALQFYNQAITTAPESSAAREAELRVAELRND